jgi:hypothetical protein
LNETTYLSDLGGTVVKEMRNLNSDWHIRFSLPFQIQNFLTSIPVIIVVQYTVTYLRLWTGETSAKAEAV